LGVHSLEKKDFRVTQSGGERRKKGKGERGPAVKVSRTALRKFSSTEVWETEEKKDV